LPLAIEGKRAASEFVEHAFLPAQNGHPEPLNVRLAGIACHSCSFTFWQIHQTKMLDWAAILLPFLSPFLVGCNCAAKYGNSLDKQLSVPTL
jgi:hypothetical protein